MPDWALFFIFVGAAVAFGVGGLLVVGRKLDSWRSAETTGSLMAVTTVVLTLFALVLAFAIVDLDGGYSDAASNIRNESSALSNIVRDMGVFPPAVSHRVNVAVARYRDEVVNVEFPALHDGRDDPRATALLGDLFVTIQRIEPTSHSDKKFYAEATQSLDELNTDRRARVEAAHSALPRAFWGLIFLTGLIGISLTWFTRAHMRGPEILMVAAISIVVGAGVLTALLLEYPFSGSIALDPGPFMQGVLAHLPRTGP
jgi:hypothetical protein